MPFSPAHNLFDDDFDIAPEPKDSRPLKDFFIMNETFFKKQVTPPTFVVENLIPPGVFLLSAPPKEGKSTFARDLARCVASGQMFAGRYVVNQGPVCYFSLDESESNVHQYLQKLMIGTNPDIPLGWIWSIPEGTTAIDLMTKWLERYPDTKLIVVDILENIVPERKTSQGVYKYDVQCMRPLKTLAAQYPALCILVLHHNNKGPETNSLNRVSGSSGLAGTAEHVGMMHAHGLDGTTDYCTLMIKGRNPGDRHSAFVLDPQTLHLIWDEPLSRANKSASDRITVYLRTCGSSKDEDLAKDLEIKIGTVRTALSRMVKSGKIIKRADDKYEIRGV